MNLAIDDQHPAHPFNPKSPLTRVSRRAINSGRAMF
jgi:hypothetical protein